MGSSLVAGQPVKVIRGPMVGRLGIVEKVCTDDGIYPIRVDYGPLDEHRFPGERMWLRHAAEELEQIS